MRKKNKPNRKLKEARERKGWSQQRLAGELGTTQTNISRWEKGTTIPGYYYREPLCKLLGMKLEDFPELLDDVDENGQSLPNENGSDSQYERVVQSEGESEIQREDFKEIHENAFHTPPIMDILSFPTYWWIPYERNSYFINREVLLKKLANDYLSKGVSPPIYVMSGTPGVGKTQVAVEYAYRYMERYQAIFWIRADEQETFFADITDIIQLLNLPEKESSNQRLMLHAFQQWLARHTNWLLIFDNAERLESIMNLISIQSRGHILLTTRTAAIGKPIVKMDVTPLEAEEGVTFLLRRANMIQQDETSEVVADHEQSQARSLVVEMGGLPLALDQAGAYIEELSCSLSEYIDLYHTYRKMLLERRGERSSGHPASLVTTISLTLEKIKSVNPGAIELLYIYTFLHPEKIPKTMVKGDVPDLSFQLQSLVTNPALLNEALGVLARYALIHIEAETSGASSEGTFLYMHRLVQDVLKDLLEENKRHQFAEQVIRVVNQAVKALNYAEWHHHHHYIAHAQACVTLIDAERIISEDAAQLLSWVARYLHEQSFYTNVESLVQKSLVILSHITEPKQLDTLDNLNQLASLWLDQGNYEEAGQLYLRILATIEPDQGPISQLWEATLYNNLGEVYDAVDRYEDAEHLFERALTIREMLLGRNHELVAISLYCLAELYSKQRKFPEATQWFQRALEIRENRLEAKHGAIGESLNGLGVNLLRQEKYVDAEPFLQRALHIREEAFHIHHISVAQTLNNLAASYIGQSKFEEAERCLQQALTINEQVLGLEHPEVAYLFINLAKIRFGQGQREEGSSYFEKAFSIFSKVFGPEHSNTKALLLMGQITGMRRE